MQPLPTYLEHYATGNFAPYVREHRLAGSAGTLIEVAQPAGDFSVPATADLVIIRPTCTGPRQELDFGAGRIGGRVRAGDLYLIAPGVASKVLIDGPHAARFMAISSEALRPQLEAARPANDPFDFGRLHAGAFRNNGVLGLMDRLWVDAEDAGPVSRLSADGAILTITAELLRAAERHAEIPRGGLAPWQVKRVTSHLNEHLAEDVSLADLAALVGLSTFHFCRAFKQSTGLPPHRWQVARRIERARELLESSNLPVTEVAARVGYDDPTLLARAFRKAVGVSPSDYRRAHRA